MINPLLRMSLQYTIRILYHEEIKKVYYEWIAFFIFVLVSSKWFAANKNCFKEFCNNAVPRSEICMIWFHCVCCVDGKITWVFNKTQHWIVAKRLPFTDISQAPIGVCSVWLWNKVHATFHFYFFPFPVKLQDETESKSIISSRLSKEYWLILSLF